MSKITGYCRVSTEEQAKGSSNDTQRDKILAYAKLKDHDVANIYEDPGISGKSMHNRPGLAAAIDEVIANKGTLVVYSLSRLSRDTIDILSLARRLNKAGAQFASIVENFDTSTAAGKLYFRMMAVLSEFERDVIAERTKSVLARKRSNGEAMGATPYGFRKLYRDTHLPPEDRPPPLEIPDENELATLEVILQMRAEGYNTAEIARKLRHLNMPPRSCFITDEIGIRHRDPAKTEWQWHRGSIRRIVDFYSKPKGKAMLSAAREVMEHCRSLDESARPQR